MTSLPKKHVTTITVTIFLAMDMRSFRNHANSLLESFRLLQAQGLLHWLRSRLSPSRPWKGPWQMQFLMLLLKKRFLWFVIAMGLEIAISNHLLANTNNKITILIIVTMTTITIVFQYLGPKTKSVIIFMLQPCFNYHSFNNIEIFDRQHLVPPQSEPTSSTAVYKEGHLVSTLFEATAAPLW